MLTGKEKAQVLLHILGPLGQVVLKKLSPESAHLLTVNIENAPQYGEEYTSAVLRELLEKANQLMSSPASSVPDTTAASSDTPQSQPDVPDSASLPDEPVDTASADSTSDRTTPPSIDYEDAAARITHQKPQIMAFFLSRLGSEERDAIMAYLPSEVIESIESISVADIPLSDKIFESLHDQIFFPQPQTVTVSD